MARVAIGAGCAAWCGALAGMTLGRIAVVVAAVAAACAALMVAHLPHGRRFMIVVGCVGVGAALSGSLAAGRVDGTLSTTLPAGRVTVEGRVTDEPAADRSPALVVVSGSMDGAVELPPVAVEWPVPDLPGPGDLVRVQGRLRGNPGFVRGDPVAGRLAATEVEVIAPASGLVPSVANTMRRRVADVLARAPGQPSALLAGFLIGDTSGLDPRRIDELRSSGLAHFVAVSGSNVALFIGAWLLLLAPFAAPRVRAAIALAGIVVFAFVTRWEASVLRAGAMAGLVFAGRLAGVPVDPIVALGWATTALLLVSADLATAVGFQLSVAATVGVMVGVRRVSGRRPRGVWSILGATAGAQLAVAPIVLVHFGSVPLMAPLANLAAAPLVVAATSLAGIGVLVGGGPILVPARLAAEAVLTIASISAGWPQLDWMGVVVVAGALGLSQWRPLRRPLAAGVALATASVLVPPAAPPGASLTALDVGQGDAVVVRDGASVMLVDGGRDPTRLAVALRRHGVDTIDLLVVTHGDADHAGGLVGIGDLVDVRTAWVPAFGDPGPVLARVAAELDASGTEVRSVSAGAEAAIGRLGVTAVGPRRRYAADNDGAVVLLVDAAQSLALLPSDVEAVAQGELPAMSPDLMLVPHHGSATTDLDWLSRTAGPLAIISVGENTYGHPAPAVLDALREAGTRVLTTQGDGDITVTLLPP